MKKINVEYAYERPRKPKLGDRVRARMGGAWKENDWYIIEGEVVEMTNTHPERPFVKYGYIAIKTKDNPYPYVAHPLDVIEVL